MSEMTKNKILDQLYRDEYFSNLFVYKNDQSLNDDLKQEIFEYLCKIDDRRIIELHNRNELKRYTHQIIKNSSHPNSPFYQKIVKNFTKISFVDEIDFNPMDEPIVIQKKDEFNILEYVREHKILNWSEWEIFVYYYDLQPSWISDVCKKRSYRELGAAFETSYLTIKKTIDSIRRKIIKKLMTDQELSSHIDIDYINKLFK